MRFMVIALHSGEVLGAVTRTKRQAFDWRDKVTKNVKADNVAAWRFHNGSGWADGSAHAYQHIHYLPSHVSVEIDRVVG